MKVRGLADIVDVYIERQCVTDSYSEALDTGYWLDTDSLVELSARCRKYNLVLVKGC